MNENTGTQPSTPESKNQTEKIEMPGSKIENSQYRGLVIELIGKGSSDNDIVRVLRKNDFRTVRQTIASFRSNYVMANQQLKEKVGQELLKIEEKRKEVQSTIPANVLKRIEIKQELIKKYEAEITKLNKEQDDRDRKGKFSVGISDKITKNIKMISDEQALIDKFLQGLAAEAMLQDWFKKFLAITIEVFVPRLPKEIVDEVGAEYKSRIMKAYEESKEELHKK